MGKISPEEYKTTLAGIELEHLMLGSVKAGLYPEKLEEDTIGLKISINDDANFSSINDGFMVENKYTLTGKTAKNQVALKIESKYLIKFSSAEEISDEFFTVYKELSLPLNVWPFFRELVNSITSKMNIPPLILPLIKR